MQSKRAAHLRRTYELHRICHLTDVIYALDPFLYRIKVFHLFFLAILAVFGKEQILIVRDKAVDLFGCLIIKLSR